MVSEIAMRPCQITSNFPEWEYNFYPLARLVWAAFTNF